MSMKFRAAPPIRGKAPRTPVYKLSSKPESISGWGVLAFALLAVAGALAAWILLRAPAVDPHFAAARRMLAGYEDARPTEQRNYNHPVYGDALAELALVDPSSRSAAEATALADSIRERIAQFQAMQKRQNDRYEAQRAHKRQLEERIFLAQERARMNPVTEFPECEKEALGKKGHSHSHEHKH